MKLQTLFVALIFLMPAVASAQPKRMPLAGQVTGLANDIRELLEKDTVLRGRKLKFGKVTAANLPNSNYELRMEKDLLESMKDLIDDASDFLVTFSYDYLKAVQGENVGLNVLQITASIKDSSRKELAQKTREVNENADIAEVLQLVVVPPANADHAKKNEEVRKAFDKPQFKVLETVRVAAAVENPNYAMEIRKRKAGNPKSPSVAVVPKDKNGLAFAEVGVSEAYEVVLYNYDPKYGVVVRLTIDGLDAVNTFNADGTPFPGYFVPPAEDGRPGERVVPGWFHTANGDATDNVLEFVVAELGKGVASAKGVRSGVGSITAVFIDAYEEGQQPRSRGETAAGPPRKVKFTLKKVHLAPTPQAIVTIRYTRGSKP